MPELAERQLCMSSGTDAGSVDVLWHRRRKDVCTGMVTTNSKRIRLFAVHCIRRRVVHVLPADLVLAADACLYEPVLTRLCACARLRVCVCVACVRACVFVRAHTCCVAVHRTIHCFAVAVHVSLCVVLLTCPLLILLATCRVCCFLPAAMRASYAAIFGSCPTGTSFLRCGCWSGGKSVAIAAAVTPLRCQHR